MLVCTAGIITQRFLLVSWCKCQQMFNVSLHLIITVLNTSVFWILLDTYQTWKHVQYISGIRAETKQEIKEVHYWRVIYLFICQFTFDYRALSVCAIPAFCFYIYDLFLVPYFVYLIEIQYEEVNHLTK